MITIRLRAPFASAVLGACLLTACESPDTPDLAAEDAATAPSTQSDQLESDDAVSENESRSPIRTLEDGAIRPGGPVNTPVPGTSGSSWPVLTAQDIQGAWQIRTDTTALGCRLTLDTANAVGTGMVTFEGDCPFEDKDARRWRYVDDLGQIYMMDDSGRIVLRLMRIAPRTFRAYRPEGWVFFELEGA